MYRVEANESNGSGSVPRKPGKVAQNVEQGVGVRNRDRCGKGASHGDEQRLAAFNAGAIDYQELVRPSREGIEGYRAFKAVETRDAREEGGWDGTRVTHGSMMRQKEL
jgi:hypothetical protein